MSTIAKKQELPHRLALSGLVVVAILVAVAGAMAFALTGGIQDNLDTMTGSNRIAITNINAYTAGDRLVITGNVQNIGSQPVDSLIIDEITADRLVITQNAAISDGDFEDEYGALTLEGLDDAGNAVGPNTHDRSFNATVHDPSAGNGPAGCRDGDTPTDDEFFILTVDVTSGTTAGNPTCTALVTISGLSTDSEELESLAAGSSKSFRIVIVGDSSGTNTDVLDILRTVPASTQLFMTVSASDGSTSTISDPRSVRVTAR